MPDFDDLFRLSQALLKVHLRPYLRSFLQNQPFASRFSMVLGHRGVGKTTVMVQHLSDLAQGDLLSPKILYIQSDHILLQGLSLYEIAEMFQAHGGEAICFDEIHKHPHWSQELKSIHDTFPRLKILASGSSALELHQGSHDLSRRALVHKMEGLSFREYLELRLTASFPIATLDEIQADHPRIAAELKDRVEALQERILPLFAAYLRHGYFPFFFETRDEAVYHRLLEQNIHVTLESDLLAVHPALTGGTTKKIARLLSVIAASVPFKPDFSALRRLMEVGDERTLKTYLKYLEDSGLIISLQGVDKGLRSLEKIEKIYLSNPNLHHVAAPGRTQVGTIRETFFLSMLRVNHRVTAPAQGDFLVNGKILFEVGGKNKDSSQIKGRASSFLALDDLEAGHGRKIPLWLFGFLY